MGNPLHRMCFILCIHLICFFFLNQRSVVAVSAYHNLPIIRSTASDKSIENDNVSINPFDSPTNIAIESLRGGVYLIPAGWNPMGYKITALGEQFLSLGDSLECDVGRFIASLKASRKRRSVIKDSWLEIVRASKKGQAMRIYRSIDELIDFCIKTGLID